MNKQEELGNSILTIPRLTIWTGIGGISGGTIGPKGDPGPEYELDEQTRKQAEEEFKKSINVEEIDINKYKGRRGER